MKYSIFSKIMAEYTIEETAKKLKEMGYDGVEWRIHEECHVKLEEVEEKSAYLKEVTEDHRLEIVTLGSYVQVFDLENAKRLFRAAVRMGCPRVRLWPAYYDGTQNYYDLLNKTRDAMSELGLYAQDNNIQVILEIHKGTIMPSASAARRLMEGFDPKRFGIIFDPGNMIAEGMENWKMGLEILGEYFAYVHFKNAGWFRKMMSVGEERTWSCNWLPLDRGMVDWAEVMSYLKNIGFDGYLSNENFTDVSMDEKLAGDIRYLRELEQRA
jgi:sugar phosphate isomerase/epimerase